MASARSIDDWLRGVDVGSGLSAAAYEKLAAQRCPVCESARLVNGQRERGGKYYIKGDLRDDRLACFSCGARYEYTWRSLAGREWVRVA